MKTTCLINSHNYIRFVGEAVKSALEQTEPFDEIIVVDDGSTDGSLEYLRREFGSVLNVQVMTKRQAGQLSCFHYGHQHASGDLVFFLDADDLYKPGLLASVKPVYQQRPEIDFVSVGYEKFGNASETKSDRRRTRDYGMSLLSTYYFQTWVGNPTTCLSMRSSLMDKVLPYSQESEWQTRADDVLVYGASMVGAHKFHLDRALIQYRIHDHNNHYGRRRNASEKNQHSIKVNQLISNYVSRMNYDVDLLRYLTASEFRTLRNPTKRDLFRYLKILSRSRLPMLDLLAQSHKILSHYLKAGDDERQQNQPADEVTRKCIQPDTDRAAEVVPFPRDDETGLNRKSA